jgi:hypothetical protein
MEIKERSKMLKLMKTAAGNSDLLIIKISRCNLLFMQI